MKKLILILVGSTLLLSGCIHKNKTDVTKPHSLNSLYQKAMNDYKNHKYNRASEEFKIIVFQYPGSKKMEEAQFYIGESYFNMKKYSDAINEYSFLVNSFVGSKYVKDAKLKIALCYYYLSPPPTLDQTDTHRAEDMFNEYLELYPDSPEADSAKAMVKECHLKYLEKVLNTARLYYKMGKYKSAEIYLQKAQNMKDHNLVADGINSLLKKVDEKLGKNKFENKNPKKSKFGE